VHLRTADAENFHVNIPLRGRVVSRKGSGEPVTTGPGDGLVYSPGAPAEMAWSTVRLATEVHLSVRALQEGFRRGLDTSPMAYLRQIRLRRAHAALLAADRDATTVRAVAVDLGLLHMSRFAAAYRAAFGEMPSDTLKRPA
jgi:AraC-like DNA-binding protein